tara:strand:+ start:77 stop:247 length:171 start_codon:yes stop_codon:yes gene_type:complete
LASGWPNWHEIASLRQQTPRWPGALPCHRGDVVEMVLAVSILLRRRKQNAAELIAV